MRPDHPHVMCRLRVRHRWLRPLRRRWLAWALLAILVVLVVSRFVEIRHLVTTLAQGEWQWVLAATLLQVVYYALYAALLQAAFASAGVQSGLVRLIPVLFESIFVGTVAPAAGLTAAAVLIDDAARRDQSPARAAEGVLLVWVAALAATVPVLFAGLGYLHSRGALYAYQVAGALIFLLYVGGLCVVLMLALWRPEWLRELLARVQRVANALAGRLCRPPLLADDWAERNASESLGAALAIVRHPFRVARTLALGLATQLVNLACLYAIFLAFDRAVELGAVAAGFAVGYVFSVISVIPFDLGMVEGVMTLVYTSLGVPAARALVIAVAFRGLNAWLPIAISVFMFRLRRPFGDGQGQ